MFTNFSIIINTLYIQRLKYNMAVFTFKQVVENQGFETKILKKKMYSTNEGILWKIAFI